MHDENYVLKLDESKIKKIINTRIDTSSVLIESVQNHQHSKSEFFMNGDSFTINNGNMTERNSSA